MKEIKLYLSVYLDVQALKWFFFQMVGGRLLSRNVDGINAISA